MNLFIFEDKARTNNLAEGWHNAFSVSSGSSRPPFFKFIAHLKLDENMARQKMVSFEAGRDPEPPKPEQVKKDAAIKKCVLSYLKTTQENMVAAQANNESDSDHDSDSNEDSDDSQESDDDEDIDDNEDIDETAANEDIETQCQKWLSSPAFQLLKAISYNTQL